MTAVWVFALAGLATFVVRAAVVLSGERIVQSERLTSALPLVAPAVLAGIVASSLTVDAGNLVRPNLIELSAVGVAMLVVHRTQNVSHALAVGFPVYWIGAASGLA